MGGLVYKTSNFADQRWQRHMGGSHHATSIVAEGISKQSDFASFAQDIHAAMYLPNEPTRQDESPDWATELLETAQELNEWHDLKRRCSRRSLAAGVATEKLLSSLVGVVPDALRQDIPPSQRKAHGGPGVGGGVSGPGEQESATGANGDATTGQPGHHDEASCKRFIDLASEEQDNNELRHKLRQACRYAKDAVNEARESLEGINQALGLPGTEIGVPESSDNLNAELAAWKMICNNPYLKRVLAEAGRMQRKAAANKRKQVTYSGASVSGVTIGGTVNEVLPVELVGLASNNPMLKLETLQKVQQRKALCYRKKSKKSKTRGPVVVAVDRSSSMRNGRTTWANAVAISILTTATKQKRPFHLIDFNGAIVREKEVPKGKKLTLSEILDVATSRATGGTDFNKPVSRALDLIETCKTMRKADVIVITDGEAELDQDYIDRANAMAKKHGVSFYIVCVGDEAEVKNSLGKIATKTLNVNATRSDDDKLCPVLNLEG